MGVKRKRAPMLVDSVRKTESEAASILRSAGMQVLDFARYVDKRGMVRFVARKTGDWAVQNSGWREISRAEAESIQQENARLNRKYLKPRMKKYF